MGEALAYIAKYRDGLGRFLIDGHLEIDTNNVKRTIRPIALNRENALFAGHDAGAENCAVIASLIETCKMNAADPHTWLQKRSPPSSKGISRARSKNCYRGITPPRCDRDMVPPQPCLYAGARCVWLATGTFTGEFTSWVLIEKATHCQMLAESRSWRSGFFCGIHLSQFSEAAHAIGQSAPRKCRAHRAQHLHREGQARPLYLSSNPSKRAIRSPLKSPGWGFGPCIERTKNWRKSWRAAHHTSSFTPCGG